MTFLFIFTSATVAGRSVRGTKNVQREREKKINILHLKFYDIYHIDYLSNKTYFSIRIE